MTAVALSVTVAGCTAGSDTERTSIRVFAAASLTDAFQSLEVAFESAQDGYHVDLNLAGSASLVTQITGGAPADVFAAANQAVMEQLRLAEAVTGPAPVFATNQLVIGVPADNPAKISGIDDLANDKLFVGLCAEGVPCGDLAVTVLAGAGVEVQADTYEPSVRALLAKVSARELDVGLVYATDVVADSNVVGIELPAGAAGTARYPIAVLDDADSPEGAQQFVAFVLGEQGQSILADHGFGKP